MKKRIFLYSLILIFTVQITFLIVYSFQDADIAQDSVAVNEAVQSVQEDWNMIEKHQNLTNLDYVVLDLDENICFQTKQDLSQTINAAIIHRDTILDLKSDRKIVGKIIIYNNSTLQFQFLHHRTIVILSAAMIAEFIICAAYIIYLNNIVIKPFQKLKDFAERIAGGNLDIPLAMDRQNLFGAFTEAFDIMRTELKKARIAESKANESKKELVAKLSHDIKTPIASIKAVSEVGIQLTDNEKLQTHYTQIIRKADQIDTLITNLFTATLEELSHLSVTPETFKSSELKTLLENSDYLRRAMISDIPNCLIYADKLRLQQVFDNIFANSYKYADTVINVTIRLDNCHHTAVEPTSFHNVSAELAPCHDIPIEPKSSYNDSIGQNNHLLTIIIEDYGGGVNDEELPLLKEKFKRGSNIKNIEGAGLGLYISDYFMKEMRGQLTVENGIHGLKVSVYLILI